MEFTYTLVFTLRNSEEQKSLFDAKNTPSVTALILGKLLLFALAYPGSMVAQMVRNNFPLKNGWAWEILGIFVTSYYVRNVNSE